MISTKTKETAILMAGFGFLSKELQEVMERKNITLDQIINTIVWSSEESTLFRGGVSI